MGFSRVAERDRCSAWYLSTGFALFYLDFFGVNRKSPILYVD